MIDLLYIAGIFTGAAVMLLIVSLSGCAAAISADKNISGVDY